jgi:NADH:ubiquinone oxidoreductase subunit 3 (subunit A)
MTDLLLIPPVTFLVMLALSWLHSRGFDAMAFKLDPAKPQPPGKFKPYACGEDVADHRSQPDYDQFFPFAFFFTIVHVVALIVTTVPVGSLAASILAVGFLFSTAVAVFVLLRR